jgi:ADP-ribosylglycohydrolase
MKSALLHRFQATLLGAIVGEKIGRQLSGRTNQPKVSLEQLIFFYANSLIHPEQVETEEDERLQQSLYAAEAAIALLPVFLFFHEDLPKLRQNLQEVTRLWHHTAVPERDLLAVGYTLSQILLEDLKPRSLIPQLLTATSKPEDVHHLQRLQTIDTLIQQRVGLDAATQLILTVSDATTGDAAIALAMYCFLSTLGDFRLAVLRAARTGYQVPWVTALTGALSGASNGTIAIPLAWRLQVAQPTKFQRLAAQLLARWSGVYSVSDLTEFTPLSVAAPQVLRKP